LGEDYTMQPFVLRWLVTSLAVVLVAWMFPNLIDCRDNFGALIGAALLLGILNAFVRPVLLLLSLPFIIVTLGLFILVVNALLLWFVSAMVPAFHVHGFWGAFFASILISIVSWPLSSFFRSSDGKMRPITYHPSVKPANARVVE
jgi:putative membrane protein